MYAAPTRKVALVVSSESSGHSGRPPTMGASDLLGAVAIEPDTRGAGQHEPIGDHRRTSSVRTRRPAGKWRRQARAAGLL